MFAFITSCPMSRIPSENFPGYLSSGEERMNEGKNDTGRCQMDRTLHQVPYRTL